jgi:OmpA-OmpF porin, OOP family
MKKRFAGAGLILCILSLLLTSVSAFAEHKAGKLYLSPMVGGYVFDGAQDQKDDMAFGLSLGYNYTEHWATEFTLNYVATEADEGNQGDVDVTIFRWDVLHHFFPESPVVPYLAAGLGGLNTNPDVGSTDLDFMVNWGGGLKYFFAENVALRADVRHIYEVDDDYNNLLYTAGLVIQFASSKATEAIDKDGDGVPDEKDLCPETPKGVEVNREGCPPDSDGDSIPDYLDKCPGTPKGIMVDETGCPLQLTLHIEFDFDKADIKPGHHADLAKAARFIQRYQAPVILIVGHTDSLGEEGYNQDLSERRAAAVRQYLIDNYDLAEEQLAFRGFGKSKPVADNATPEGRQQNRRVEVICCTVIPE